MATFDLDPDTLPPLTKAIRDAWPTTTGPYGNTVQHPPRANPEAFGAILDAVHDLEQRITQLETP